MGSTSKSSACSTLTARAGMRATAVWCRISSCRPLRGADITIYGDRSQTRSFCHAQFPDRELVGIVGDLIRGFLMVMGAPCAFRAGTGAWQRVVKTLTLPFSPRLQTGFDLRKA